MNVSCDALVATMCAVGTYLIVRVWKRGFTWPLGMVMGVAIGLALLTKIPALVLPIPFAMLFLSEAQPWRTRLKHTTVLALPLIMGLPWMLFNQMTYGDPLALRAGQTAMLT